MTKHVFGRALPREEVVEVWMPRRVRPEADALGLGYWAGFERSTDSADGAGGAESLGSFVGWWCLTLDGSERDPERPLSAELGYRLHRRAWGKGYGTEGARAMLRHGFETAGLASVWAEVAAGNAGSRRILEKVGLRASEVPPSEWGLGEDDPDTEVLRLDLTREEYRPAR